MRQTCVKRIDGGCRKIQHHFPRSEAASRDLECRTQGMSRANRNP